MGVVSWRSAPVRQGSVDRGATGTHPCTQLCEQVHQAQQHALERGHLAGYLRQMLPQHMLVFRWGDGGWCLATKVEDRLCERLDLPGLHVGQCGGDFGGKGMLRK